MKLYAVTLWTPEPEAIGAWLNPDRARVVAERVGGFPHDVVWHSTEDGPTYLAKAEAAGTTPERIAQVHIIDLDSVRVVDSVALFAHDPDALARVADDDPFMASRPRPEADPS